MARWSAYDRLTKKYIKRNKYVSFLIDYDKDPGKLIAKGLANRDYLYSELLENYISLTKFRNKAKEFHKWLFFWIIVAGSGLLCFVLLKYVVAYTTTTKNAIFSVQDVVTFLGVLISLLSTVISIPLIITKYLFNNKEDDNIRSIIEKTQEHDNVEIKLFAKRFELDNKDNNENPEGNNGNNAEKVSLQLDEDNSYIEKLEDRLATMDENQSNNQ